MCLASYNMEDTMRYVSTFKIGIVGEIDFESEKDAARLLLRHAINMAIMEEGGGRPVEIVTGLVNEGIPALAFELALERKYKTAGISTEEAWDYEWLPVDQCVLDCLQWGEQRMLFRNYIHALVRIGGGKQPLEDVAAVRKTGKPVYEFDPEASTNSS